MENLFRELAFICAVTSAFIVIGWQSMDAHEELNTCEAALDACEERGDPSLDHDEKTCRPPSFHW